jgi:ribonuclease G
MQSAFVDIGLERDAFLYVSDFMDLEEQDEDLTDTVPASRTVQDLRQQPAQPEHVASTADASETASVAEAPSDQESGRGFAEGEQRAAQPSASASEGQEPANGVDLQNRDRGWRSRRRRRGGRRDGRDRGFDRGLDRGPDSRFARPAETRRGLDDGRNQSSEPPPGYEPILLPGESISKYQRWAQQAPASRGPESAAEAEAALPGEPVAPLASTFPEDEPLFAAAEAVAEPLHEEHEDIRTVPEELAESAAVTTEWNRELRRPEEAPLPALGWPGEARVTGETYPALENEEISQESDTAGVPHPDHPAPLSREEPTPVFAAPGTMEEETIEEEEADTIHYESSAEEEYDEFEEETQAAGPAQLNGEARETVAEIHMSSLAEAGEAHAEEATPAEAEEDAEELELEEAQAEAEAMLEAEARADGTADARAEVRAPSGTAGYTQRAPRPAWERRGPRGRRSGGRRFRRRESAPVPLISDLLKEGQEILVQIAKEPIGKKGARITSHIALPGRFLVYMPTVNHTGVSRKISSEEERQRLKRIIQSERENGHGGFIVRTAAQNASEDELRADIRFLKGLWNDIRTRAESSKPPALIYHDLNVVERVLRDQVTSDFSVVWVDSEPEYERILRFFNRFQPALVKRVKLYTKETPLFEQFGLAEEMNKALKSKVWLKSGGYIVINQTEALVAIDINTGKYVGKTQRLEDTIVKTNVDAIKEIVRQIRLRDLGGIIIIDFIDMDERRNRQKVMQALEEELRHDRAPSKTLQFNDFGLVAITRKRVKQSLERTIGAPCPYCQATGYVKSVATICNEIYVEMRKITKHLEHQDVMLRVHPDVAKELKSSNARLLNEMEELTKRTIIVKSDPALHQEQFDIN